MRPTFFRPLFLAACLVATPAAAQEEAAAVQPLPPPVVLELFTSQGCAFCPPADQLLAQMAQQENVIALACHVDYFGVPDDKLGQAFCTKRQNDYTRLIGTGPRYTPQMVINGHFDVIGYELTKINNAILKARDEKIAQIPLEQAGESSYSFSLPETKLVEGGPVKLWMAVFDKPKTVKVAMGGNSGRTIDYVNVISRMEDLGDWDGASVARAINADYTDENAGVAIFAQDVKTGRIIAAGSASR